MTVVSGNIIIIIILKFVKRRTQSYRGCMQILVREPWREPQMRVGLLTTATFGDMSGYFFGNFRDKASNII